MPVVRHDDIGKNTQSEALLRFAHDAHEGQIVFRVAEQQGAKAGPVQDVVRHAGQSHTLTSWHSAWVLRKFNTPLEMAETAKGSRPLLAVLISGRGSNLQ